MGTNEFLYPHQKIPSEIAVRAHRAPRAEHSEHRTLNSWNGCLLVNRLCSYTQSQQKLKNGCHNSNQRHFIRDFEIFSKFFTIVLRTIRSYIIWPRVGLGSQKTLNLLLTSFFMIFILCARPCKVTSVY